MYREPESLMRHLLFSAHSTIADAFWELCGDCTLGRDVSTLLVLPGQNIAVKGRHTWRIFCQLMHFLSRDS